MQAAPQWSLLIVKILIARCFPFFYHDNRKTGALVKQMRLTVHETPFYFVQFSYLCLLSRTLAALLVIFQLNAHNLTF